MHCAAALKGSGTLGCARRDGAPGAAFRGTRGFSLVEVTISVAIVLVALQIVSSTMFVMARSNNFGAREMDLSARSQLMLGQIGRELMLTSSDLDPATLQSFAVASGDPGNMQLNFRRVVDFADLLGELVPVWSTEIVYRLDPEQRAFVREQDGNSAVLLRNMESLDFEVDVLGRVRVKIGVRVKDKEGEHVILEETCVNTTM